MHTTWLWELTMKGEDFRKNLSRENASTLLHLVLRKCMKRFCRNYGFGAKADSFIAVATANQNEKKPLLKLVSSEMGNSPLNKTPIPPKNVYNKSVKDSYTLG